MRRWVSGLIGWLALALTGCGGGDDPGGVAIGDRALRERTFAEGRALVALAAAGDTTALVSRFSPEMVRAVPEPQLARTLASITGKGPLGPRLGESARSAGAVRIYLAEHQWNGQRLRITVWLGPSGAVDGLLLTPREALPPDPKAGYQTKTALRLPFGGEWMVFWGGMSEVENYHVEAPDQRHAYDFVVLKDGATHRGDGGRNEDYHAWGRPVLAPADAVVASAKDGVPDNRPGPEGMNPAEVAGNYVILDFENGEYALIAHFRKGSLRVGAGDRVRAGQVLGLCGNSGNSSEPHIHFHLQDGPRPFAAVGLPAPFSGYLADGERVERGVPRQGQQVRPAQNVPEPPAPGRGAPDGR